MKRANSRSNFLIAAILFAAAVAAFAPTVFAWPQASAPVSRGESEPSTSQGPQKASGIVPPGVKLAPEMPAPGAPRPFEFPAAATKTLPNGLRVFVVTDHREPAVAARLVILSAGSIQDPAGMPGVAGMTAGLLTQGTAKRSAKEIAEAIDFVGGTLEAKAGRDATTVTLDVVKKDLGVGMDLLSDVVLHPSFQRRRARPPAPAASLRSGSAVLRPELSGDARVRAHVVRRFALRFARTRHSSHDKKTAARRFREISRRELRAESSAAGFRRRHHARRSLRDRREIFRQLAEARRCSRRAAGACERDSHPRLAD